MRQLQRWNAKNAGADTCERGKSGAALTHKYGEIMAPMSRNRYAIRELAKRSAPCEHHASRMRRHGPARANLE